ncbi:hypothetical protein SAMN04488542_112129 [Fontibacillus panacisegetis]|uniref:Alpha/beta hydrolase n=1 Tax=Fontibacillus panacisegetis TaxID=670482 RepID=A0A1G7M0K5_9BACL|nr:alpha/beta hydrolase [Fontibacillus panacisegetis]SDF55277.1 hypothetical protein SAMN04488542_112129 [Fontibacillus panacisegetis]
MMKQNLVIKGISAILWGEASNRIYIYVHGKMSSKEAAQEFAEIAAKSNFQVLSFDLPEHGERKDTDYTCEVWNGVHDLRIIGEYVQQHWEYINLYAVSLGAYFSLLAYQNSPIHHCLFQSPILDMEHLIQDMMTWFDVNEEMLEKHGKISTPMGETLDWDYYCYVKNHPVHTWNIPTEILYGSEDDLTRRDVIDHFVSRFNANLTVLQGSEHYFHTEQQLDALKKWLSQHICSS